MISQEKKVSEVELDEYEQEKRQALLDKYDPGETSTPVPQLSNVEMHRMMMRELYLDNVLWATARLQRHVWIATSNKEAYEERRLSSFYSEERKEAETCSVYG